MTDGRREDESDESGPRWSVILLAWSIPAIIAMLQSAAGYAVRNRLDEWPWILHRGLKTFSWVICTPLIFRLGRRFPMRREAMVPHGAVHMVAALSIAFVFEYSWSVLSAIYTSVLGHLQLIQFAPEPAVPANITRMGRLTVTLGTLVSNSFVYVAVLAIASTLERDRRLRERDVITARLEAQLAQAQVQALKMQVHPHFLFNSLHAVTVLIDSAPSVAKQMVVRLGDMLRLSLSRAASAEVTLERELELLRLYFEIEQMRFRDRLTVRYEVDPAVLSALVPDLVLQPLAENAVKHGIGTHAQGGTITIRGQRQGSRLQIEIENDGRELDDGVHAHEGVGLAITRARLGTLYGGQQQLTLSRSAEGSTIARVDIPYRVASAST